MTEQHQEPNVEETAAEQTTPPAAPTADTPEAQLAALEAKVAELQDAYLRAKAESENMRRRAAEDVTKAHKFAVEKFARELIAVGDPRRCTGRYGRGRRHAALRRGTDPEAAAGRF